MYFVHENEVHSNFQVTMVQDCAYFTTINESKIIAFPLHIGKDIDTFPTEQCQF